MSKKLVEFKVADDLWSVACNTVDGRTYYTVRAKTNKEALEKALEFFKNHNYVNVATPYTVLPKEIIE